MTFEAHEAWIISQFKRDMYSEVVLTADLNDSRHPAGYIIQGFLSKLGGQRQGEDFEVTIKLLSGSSSPVK